MSSKQTKAFTLVELIVVITILAILGTIAFISLQGYSRDARDSVRVSDLSNIEKQLELYLVKGAKVPLPDDALTLLSSGTTIGYQGTIGEESLNKIGVHGGGKDPLDDTYYTYRINEKKTAYQVMGYLKNETPITGILSQTNVADLTNRGQIIYGHTLGILVDQITNKPLDKIETTSIELRTYTDNEVDVYLSTDTKKVGVGTGTTGIYGTLETLANYQNFTLPLKCPKGFIEVPGNRDIGQPTFCVAKYEMTYSDADTPTSGGAYDWNTVSYILGKPIFSQSGKYPIANITSTGAIAACGSMGKGYHLITNNEWMTIARNIEKQPINWSGGIVGQNFIFNGVSDSDYGCGNTQTGTIDIYTSLSREWGTKTGGGFGNIDCDNKRKLMLSNGKEIWDFSGNVREFVNGDNSIYSSNGVLNNVNSCDGNDWYSWIGIDGATGGTCDFSNGYSKELYGPLGNYNANNGIGMLRSSTIIDQIFIRGECAIQGDKTGIYSLLSATLSSETKYLGFRCAYIK